MNDHTSNRRPAASGRPDAPSTGLRATTATAGPNTVAPPTRDGVREAQPHYVRSPADGPPTGDLGKVLVAKGVVSEDQMRIARTEQRHRDEPLGRILVRLGFATEGVIRDMLAGVLGYDSVDLSKVLIDSDVVKRVPRETARRYRVLALTHDPAARQLAVATTDPFNVVAMDQVRALFDPGVEIRAVLAGEVEIDKAIEQFYGHELSLDGILVEIETGEVDARTLETGNEEYGQPVVRLVNALLSDAVRRGASDIHFEPAHEFLRIRYRIDGVLRQIRSLHRNHWAAIAVRLKVMASMSSAERRVPQDGRISLSVSGRDIDFRVSSLPTIHGENIVLRVLDRHQGIVALDRLGLADDALAELRLMMARPEGIILVTGPTGSGKSTTLYSMLSHLDTESVNIMTLEDPVEYPMGRVRQTAANEAARLTFASGVRSLLRQDPDIILIGEIRDAETAEMAFRAAMTGHQVYSTLHSNSAAGAVARLVETGVSPGVMAGNIIGIMGQRLVRRLCSQCREAYEPARLERRILGLGPHSDSPPVYRPRGCERCEHQGYRGRLALLELLRFDAELDELVARGASPLDISKAAGRRGFRPLADDGIRRVLEGVTSLDEVSRVVDLTGRVGG